VEGEIYDDACADRVKPSRAHRRLQSTTHARNAPDYFLARFFAARGFFFQPLSIAAYAFLETVDRDFGRLLPARFRALMLSTRLGCFFFAVRFRTLGRRCEEEARFFLDDDVVGDGMGAKRARVVREYFSTPMSRIARRLRLLVKRLTSSRCLGANMQSKVSSFLWFDSNAEIAVKRYAEIFGADCRVSGTSFELFGQRFIAFNGGPHYKMNEAFSIMVDCENQGEIDRLWDALLSGGGSPSRCGWLKDAFGVSWQIVPKQLFALLRDPDRSKASRVQKIMLTMGKLDIAMLENA
jgi:predicted 3-demethylubiquinone-9 3-methyltransferase (glyoxalase superfamily)